MVTINEIYNNLWTSLARIVVMQSFSILVVTTDGELQVIVAPTRFIKFEQSEKGSSDAKYITPEPKIEEVRKVLIDLKDELQNFSQVPSEIISQTGGSQFPQSGYALRIKRIPIENLWQDRRMSYGPSFMKLIQMSLVIDEYHTSGKIRPLTEIHPSIRFTETIPGLDPQEQAIKDEQEIKYAIISPVDLMIRQNPYLSRQEAKDKILANRKEMEDLGMSAFGYLAEGDEDRSSFREVEELKARTNVTRQGVEQSVRRRMEEEDREE